MQPHAARQTIPDMIAEELQPPESMSLSQRLFLNDLFQREADKRHDDLLELLEARLPRKESGPGAALGIVAGLLAVAGAIGAAAVAMERTREVPEIRAVVARHQTAIEVNHAEHAAILQGLERIEKRLPAGGAR